MKVSLTCQTLVSLGLPQWWKFRSAKGQWCLVFEICHDLPSLQRCAHCWWCNTEPGATLNLQCPPHWVLLGAGNLKSRQCGIGIAVWFQSKTVWYQCIFCLERIPQNSIYRWLWKSNRNCWAFRNLLADSRYMFSFVGICLDPSALVFTPVACHPWPCNLWRTLWTRPIQWSQMSGLCQTPGARFVPWLWMWGWWGWGEDVGSEKNKTH